MGLGFNNKFKKLTVLNVFLLLFPQCTLTGHSRKVTSAKFKSSHHHVVTGSVDRTVKIWDLQRTACIHTTDVNSSCSEVVCAEYFIISGHYDQKIRFWDSSPDGDYAVAGSSDGALYIWNVTKEQLETCLLQQHRYDLNHEP
ncbi:A16L2 protein, partial [Polypterus senegalus]|nr:A16L2 protein [Polypterus senegalus]